MPDDGLQPVSRKSRPALARGWFSSLDRGAIQSGMLCIIAGVLMLAALDAARLIAVPAVLALLCAIALAPSVRWLERTGAPASLCAAFVVSSLLLGAATAAYSLSPSVEAWNDRTPQLLREIERRVRAVALGVSNSLESDPAAPAEEAPVPNSPAALAASAGPPAQEAGDDAVGKLVEGGQRLLADWAIGAPRLAASAAFWAMLTFFLLRDREMLARGGLSLVPGISARRAVGRAMRDVRTSVARYLLAITLVNLGLGVCTATAFALLGVPNAPLWGVASALLNFMPFIGLAILALATLGLGILSFDDPVVAFAPLAVVIGLYSIEGNVVTPMVVGARIRIAPIAIFVTIAFGAWLWGAAGALVATPTLIVVVAFVRRLNGASHLSGPARRNDRGQKGRKRQ